MEEKKGIKIVDIKPDSIADEIGIEPGDELVSIQGQTPGDYVEFLYLISEPFLEIVIRKDNGEEWLLDIERDPGDELGIQLDGIIYDQLQECDNNCMFCFVNQMPEGLRRTLSLKDDDYRFSFLQGSYVTLTNLDEEEFERIKRLRLSPIYVSVHTTNPDLRVRMMRNKDAAGILEQLRELKEAGISFHTQLVLCPDLNDGEELERSLKELSTLRPNILSLAVVPVGLTKYREGLFPLESYTPEQAEEVYQIVNSFQEELKKENDNFIYLSDEFYLLSGHALPEEEEYNGFPQLENGVGTSRLLLDEFESLKNQLPDSFDKQTNCLMVTGVLASKVLKEPIEALNDIEGLDINLLSIKNKFFGETVTVAGLLTGRDLIEAIENSNPEEYDYIILPEVVLNDDKLFIDGVSKEEFKEVIPNTFFVSNFKELIDLFSEENIMEVK